MAAQHGVAGEWARVRGAVFAMWPFYLAWFLLGAFITALILGKATWVFALLLFASLAYIPWAWHKGLQRVNSFFVGARGEERVAASLSLLPSTYHIFNDFLACGLRVDHVVVGPAGVFAVETKNWRGRVTLEDEHILVEGHLPDRSPLSQAIHETDKVRDELAKKGWSGDVRPIVCFASNTFAANPSTVGASLVLNVRDVVSWIETQGTILSTSDVERLVQLMSCTN